MEIGKTKLALTASALAMALMLAGCGGSSSSGGVSSAGGGGSGGTTPTVTPEPDTPEPTSGEQANTLFSQANDAESAAEKAGEMATDALAKAKKMAGMLDVISVAGNSMTAMNNAQAILTAQADVGKALADAEKAKMDAEAAQTAANALPADTPELASLKAEAKEAVDAAKGAIAAIEAIQKAIGPGTLAAHVFAVEGLDGKGTPTKTGEGIAKMIGPAFATLLDGDGGTNDRVKHSTGTGEMAPPTKAMPIKNGVGNTMNLPRRPPFPGHDAPATAMTWAEIVGSPVKRQIDRQITDDVQDDDQTRTVDVASIAGTAITLIDSDGDSSTELAADFFTNAMANGKETTAHWRGIAGTMICGGTDCDVESGKLTGSWLFTPSVPAQRYTRAPNSNTYSAYNLYATYGYWLSHATGGLVTVNTYAGQSHGRTAAAHSGVLVASDTLADSATYTGSAIGMSMMKSFDGTTGKEMGHKSGEFTAMVTLNAEFNANPILRGKIDQFVGVGADPNWSVTLEETQFTDAIRTTGGVAKGSGTTERAADGVWTAQAYGVDTVGDVEGKRPTGIFGGFNAHFDNGHAAGAYATRMKQ